MRLEPPADLSPEDLIASKPVFTKVFQGFFPYSSLNFYFPDRPQSALIWKEGEHLEEFVDRDWTALKEISYHSHQKRLFLPMILYGRLVAVLVFFGVPSFPESLDKVLLTRLAGLALEMASLKKQNQLDPFTGLYHELAFRKFLVQSLKEWSKEKLEIRPKKLSLAEKPFLPAPVLGFLSLRPVRKKNSLRTPVQKEEHQSWIRRVVKASPAGTILGAIQHHPLVIGILKNFDEPRQEITTVLSHEALQEGRDFYCYLGWACPDGSDQETVQGNPSLYQQMTRWWEKAWTALQLAHERNGPKALGYDEILFKAGKVTDLLPGQRLVMNLGQRAGVRPHMRFTISDCGDPAVKKGLVMPLDIEDDHSIAEVIHATKTDAAIQKLDDLWLATASDYQDFGSEEVPLTSETSSFQRFRRAFHRTVKETDRFTLFIARLDDSSDRLEIWGERTLREIQKELKQIIQNHLGPADFMESYGRDGLIGFLSGSDKIQSSAWGQDRIDQCQDSHNLSISFGLADYPCNGFSKEEILDNVIKTLDHLSFLGPRSVVTFDAVSLNISGDRLYNRGDLKGAVQEYRKALLLDPQNVNVLNSLGVCHAQMDELDEAMRCFQNITDLVPGDYMASFNLGFTYLRRGEEPKAIATWEELAATKGINFELAFHLGKIYQEKRDYAKALNWFKKAEEEPNRKGVISRYLGEACLRLEMVKEAMGYFKKTLKSHPQDAFSLSHLGALYLRQGESLGVALSLCRQATRIDPFAGAYWLNLGRAYLLNGNPKEALAALHQALEQGESSPDLYKLLGQSFAKIGKAKEARASFTESLKRDPDDDETRRFLQELE
jgi:tetratricopeptide (TPR) repeat protein